MLHMDGLEMTWTKQLDGSQEKRGDVKSDRRREDGGLGVRRGGGGSISPVLCYMLK
jgi:hypothetical protein